MRVSGDSVVGMICEDVHRATYDAVGGISILLAAASVVSAFLVFIRVHL